MTVVFADLVGSTALVDRMDPEDLVEVMNRYQVAITAAAERYEGAISGYLGDGVRILFGYPFAREDAPHRAVRASLDIIDIVRRLGTEITLPSGVSLEARVGVATGTVVASLNAAIARLDDNLVGSPLNLAARLQGLASPNQVVIAEATQRLTGSAFSYRDLGQHHLKGFHLPAQAFAVTGEIRGQSRLARRLVQTRTPLVNRVAEQRTLAEYWDFATAGQSQFVCIYGDAGMGKSRLADALAERLSGHTGVTLWMQCTSMLMNTALHPHIDFIERSCAFETHDDRSTRIEKLRPLAQGVSGDDDERNDAIALLASMMSIAPGPDLPRLEMSPQLQKQRTFDLLQQLLVIAAAKTPILLVYEDVHWMDPSSRELAGQLARTVGSSALMVVSTSRPQAPSPWAEAKNASTLHLLRLSTAESAEMVGSFESLANLPPAAIARIVQQTDGVPLFVEEMARMVVDAGGQSTTLALPETLRDLLTERLDKLGSAKAIAQIGSVIGRSFSISLAATVSGATPGLFTPGLLTPEIGRLLASGLVERSDDPDILVFKHALVQDAAYGSVLLRHRRDLHARVADGLIADFPGTVEAAPELVARHLNAADKLIDAAQWWLRAGGQAIGRGATAEAVAHLEAGLEGLARLPAGPVRQHAELQVLAVLGPARMVRNGPGSPLFGAVQRRAFDAMHLLQDRPSQFPVTYGLALFHWGRAEFELAAQLARELVSTSHEQPTAEHVMAGNNILAMVQFHRGESRDSNRLLRRSVAIYDPDQHHELYPRYMMDFGVFGRFYLALASLMIGDGPEARRRVREAMPLAIRLHQPHSRGFAMLANFTIACMRRDVETALLWASECIEFSTEQGFPEFAAMATIVRGWAMAQRENADLGLQMLDRGIVMWSATGFETWQSWFSVLRSELLVKLGRSSDAMAEIAAQEARIAANGEHQFASLLESVKARALELDRVDETIIEAAYQRAIGIAVGQGAIAWRLQVSLSHAEWLRRRGLEDRARKAVSEVVDLLPAGVMPIDLLADWRDHIVAQTVWTPHDGIDGPQGEISLQAIQQPPPWQGVR